MFRFTITVFCKVFILPTSFTNYNMKTKTKHKPELSFSRVSPSGEYNKLGHVRDVDGLVVDFLRHSRRVSRRLAVHQPESRRNRRCERHYFACNPLIVHVLTATRNIRFKVPSSKTTPNLVETKNKNTKTDKVKINKDCAIKRIGMSKTFCVSYFLYFP